MCANFTQWLDTSESAQAALDATAPPAFLSTAVTSKLDPIEAEVTARGAYQSYCANQSQCAMPCYLQLLSQSPAPGVLGCLPSAFSERFERGRFLPAISRVTASPVTIALQWWLCVAP